ncbi:MAG: hypothetical protein AMJ90_01250 [candidate division Zixibacteria bacterium SM23_73_2]|nr:MAG: hypothetical protein AMJ90_01250 [candidate division Zixibacteria bacterium SM23_73_2]
MAVKAFVLIETKIDAIKSNAKKLMKKPHVKSAYSVAGPYDIIAMVEAKDYRDISKIVAKEIHSLPGILRTTTLLAFE